MSKRSHDETTCENVGAGEYIEKIKNVTQCNMQIGFRATVMWWLVYLGSKGSEMKEAGGKETILFSLLNVYQLLTAQTTLKDYTVIAV